MSDQIYVDPSITAPVILVDGQCYQRVGGVLVPANVSSVQATFADCEGCGGVPTYVEIQRCQGNAPGGGLLPTNIISLAAGYYFDPNKQQNYYYNGTSRTTTAGGSYTLNPISDCSYGPGSQCIKQAMDLIDVVPYASCQKITTSDGSYAQLATNFGGWNRYNLWNSKVGGSIFATGEEIAGWPALNAGGNAFGAVAGCPLCQTYNSGASVNWGANQPGQAALWQPSASGPPYTIYVGVGLTGGNAGTTATAVFVASFQSNTPLNIPGGGYNLLTAQNIPNLFTSPNQTLAIPDNAGNVYNVTGLASGGYVNLYASNMAPAANLPSSLMLSGGGITTVGGDNAAGINDFGTCSSTNPANTSNPFNGVLTLNSSGVCSAQYISGTGFSSWGGPEGGTDFSSASLTFNNGNGTAGGTGWYLTVCVYQGCVTYAMFNSPTPQGTYYAYNSYVQPQTLTVS